MIEHAGDAFIAGGRMPAGQSMSRRFPRLDFIDRNRPGNSLTVRQSSKMATGRHQPAEAPLILTGKQATWKPKGRGRFPSPAIFSM
jgi:hypothetical protein